MEPRIRKSLEPIRSTAELEHALSQMPIASHKIISVDIEGRLLYTDRGTMLNCYNDSVRKDTEPYRRSSEPIYQDEIPLSIPMTRLVLSNGPFIIGLDNGARFEISMPDPSCAFVHLDDGAKTRPKNTLVNASGILRPIIGEIITDIEVRPMGKDSQERDYIDRAYQTDPFEQCLVRCEKHSLGIFWNTCMVMTNDEKPWPLEMAMGELKENIGYYDELFDKRDNS